MLIYSFRASYPNFDLISSVDFYLGDVGKNYNHYKSIGFFKKMPEKAIFIYRIHAHGKVYNGVVAANDLEDIKKKNILGHEHTILEKEQEMLSKMLLRKAMIKPVLLGYHPTEEVLNFINDFTSIHSPIIQLQPNNLKEKHLIWAITERKEIEEFKSLFREHIKVAYIADGHHRSKVTTNLLEKSFLQDEDGTKHPALLSAFFPMDELSIYEFNRVVEVPEHLTLVNFIVRCSAIFEILPLKEAKKPQSKYHIHLYMDHCWYELKWKDQVLDKYRMQPVILDVDIFNHEVLESILDVEDIKTASTVMYVPGHLGLNALVDQCKHRKIIAFSFFPVQNQDVVKISENGDVLPPKSTWFEPRMHNGVLIKEF